MNFALPLRNVATGEERNFSDKQQISNFMAGCVDPQQWEGWAHLGPLPPATVQDVQDGTGAQRTDGL